MGRGGTAIDGRERATGALDDRANPGSGDPVKSSGVFGKKPEVRYTFMAQHSGIFRNKTTGFPFDSARREAGVNKQRHHDEHD